MDAYERSLKQQADRIKRELSREGKVTPPAPALDATEDFVPSDVPSPIYGYARPKPKISLPVEHSPETREELTNHDVMIDDVGPVHQVDETDHSADNLFSQQSSHISEISEETDEAVESESGDKPLLGDVSIIDGGFSSVFMQSTGLTSTKVEFVEEQAEISPQENIESTVSPEMIGQSVENVAERLQTVEEQLELPEDTELTPAVSVSFKADKPPVNVMMTPKDRMAMYRNRRLGQKNNNL